MKTDLRMMVTRGAGGARHVAFRLPGADGWWSMCGELMDERRTANVERWHKGRVRRPDCRHCAEIVRRGGFRALGPWASRRMVA